MDVKIEEGWKKYLSPEFEKPYFKALTERVRHDYADPSVNVYPPGREIFAAFDASSFDNTKVVIIGQDPYHGPGNKAPAPFQRRYLARSRYGGHGVVPLFSRSFSCQGQKEAGT